MKHNDPIHRWCQTKQPFFLYTENIIFFNIQRKSHIITTFLIPFNFPIGFYVFILKQKSILYPFIRKKNKKKKSCKNNGNIEVTKHRHQNDI